MNINRVHIYGRLTRDPELRKTQSGQSVASVTIATNDFWTDKSGTRQERTQYHNIVLWGRLAEIAGQYLSKSQGCYIEGKLQTRKYTAKDGSERSITEIVGDHMQLGGRSNAEKKEHPTATPQSDEQEDGQAIHLDEEKEEIKIEDVPF